MQQTDGVRMVRAGLQMNYVTLNERKQPLLKTENVKAVAFVQVLLIVLILQFCAISKGIKSTISHHRRIQISFPMNLFLSQSMCPLRKHLF